jgi:hypothetical protein
MKVRNSKQYRDWLKTRKWVDAVFRGSLPKSPYEREKQVLLGFGHWHADARRFIEAYEWFYADRPCDVGHQTIGDFAKSVGFGVSELRMRMTIKRPGVHELFARLEPMIVDLKREPQEFGWSDEGWDIESDGL